MGTVYFCLAWSSAAACNLALHALVTMPALCSVVDMPFDHQLRVRGLHHAGPAPAAPSWCCLWPRAGATTASSAQRDALSGPPRLHRQAAPWMNPTCVGVGTGSLCQRGRACFWCFREAWRCRRHGLCDQTVDAAGLRVMSATYFRAGSSLGYGSVDMCECHAACERGTAGCTHPCI